MSDYEEFLSKIIQRKEKCKNIYIEEYENNPLAVKVKYSYLKHGDGFEIEIYFGDIIEQQFIDKTK